MIWKWPDWCFRPRFCTCKAILGRAQPGRMRWILSWSMPLAKDRLLDLLASSPARYHWTTDAPKHEFKIHCDDIYNIAFDLSLFSFISLPPTIQYICSQLLSALQVTVLVSLHTSQQPTSVLYLPSVNRCCILSLERQKGLTTSHINMQLDPFYL